MKHSTRKPSELSDSLTHHLNMYALAASSDQSPIGYGAALAAIGLGMLTLPAAQARIIYTSANIVVSALTPLDLNHDGNNDFFLYASGFRTTNGFGNDVWAVPLVTPNAFFEANPPSYAAALHPGAQIGGKNGNGFDVYGGMAHSLFNSTNRTRTFKGPWANGGKGVKNRYLGLRFVIKGKIHYGWARLNVFLPGSATHLTGYAYETVPNKPIIAGKRHDADDHRVQQANTASRGATELAGLGAWLKVSMLPRNNSEQRLWTQRKEYLGNPLMCEEASCKTRNG